MTGRIDLKAGGGALLIVGLLWILPAYLYQGVGGVVAALVVASIGIVVASFAPGEDSEEAGAA